MNIYVNGRFQAHKVTGVQRVAHEITRRLTGDVEICQPKRSLTGWQGHLWEQTTLPRQCRGGVLWSPCASGPIGNSRHVVTFHDLFAVDSPQWYQPAYASWYAYSLAKLARTARHIIAVSEYTKRRIMARFAITEAKITVVHNGVGAPFFDAGPAAAPAARAALGLPPGRYLLSVGSLEPRKNFKSLLRAWKDVVHELPEDLWLVICGARDQNVYRNAGLRELPARVHMSGYVPDEFLPGLYAGSLAFIYPSLAEGFGLPPLEAMACGAPVLTSNSTALPEVCSTAALYFDPSNIADLARGIKLLTGEPDLRRNLAQLGREQAARFNWERTAKQTLGVLRAIASDPHSVFC